ncbi:uncharacterized protein RHOBADRAFT_49403 [Rhodotorula graminis WP1]|uniref:Major facilitator superfamily (MFS) profile domain-containing protein n=1 Tax=Rhodotorula graminis (strain WP1) TaxID=578459 RepID=A0A194SCH2_RHOGW|nr:uncharacterized protein RHOBADRAFT_49403 [Rhodotorula graminis WP1]KPV77091.1 hypothetical protein RHOBADRAFT_49403 [Rhodotorula graminis WP1]
MAHDLKPTSSKEQDAFEERDERAEEEAITLTPDERKRLERKLVRKIDARFSILIVIYILNYIDRNNASAARTKGLEEDLGLKGKEMDTLLSILYLGYVLMQIPSNMGIQYCGRPSIVIPTAVLLWGAVSTGMGATHSFGPALACRFLLGFVEAAFFPGALMTLAAWYPKRSLGKRFTGLYCGSLISNALGPVLAAGILGTMEGKGGVRAWRWLFYIEGSLTMAVAVIAFFVLPDFPHNTRWGFSKEEKQLAVQRMTEDVGMKDDTSKISNWEALKLSLCDYKLWMMALALTSVTVGLSFNQFFPQITKTLGYSNTASLLLCAPPFLFAAICAFLVSAHSDKVGERYLHIVVPFGIGIIGFIIAATTSSFGPRYFSLFCMAQSYSGFVCLLAWISSTFSRPAMTRSISLAFANALSQLGNIAGAYCFDKRWGPSYTRSWAICIATFAFSIFVCTLHRLNLARLNRKLAARDEVEAHGKEHAAVDALDYPAGFRYML